MGTAPLFLVEALPAGDLAELDGAEGRHAVLVRRLRVGEAVALTDGRGRLAHGVVETVTRDGLTARITGVADLAPPVPRVVLVQALVKGDRGELAVELATEAGVDAVVPWRASRCVARWDDGPRGVKALGRWRSSVRAAAKQSRRPFVPLVAEPVSTAELVGRVGAAAAALVLHEGAEDPVTGVELPVAGDLLLVVGPEGGITDDEITLLTDAGARPVRLGPEVLRASTAAAVALGALGVLTRRWDR